MTDEKCIEIRKPGICPDCGKEKTLQYWTMCSQWICKDCLNYWYKKARAGVTYEHDEDEYLSNWRKRDL